MVASAAWAVNASARMWPAQASRSWARGLLVGLPAADQLTEGDGGVEQLLVAPAGAVG